MMARGKCDWFEFRNSGVGYDGIKSFSVIQLIANQQSFYIVCTENLNVIGGFKMFLLLLFESWIFTA